MFDRHRPADDASMCREVVIAYLFSILCLTGNVDAVHAFEHRRSDCKEQAGLAWGCFGGIAMAFLLFALCTWATHFVRCSCAKKGSESSLHAVTTARISCDTQAVISCFTVLMDQIWHAWFFWLTHAGVVIGRHTSSHFVLILSDGSDLACRSFYVDLCGPRYYLGT